VAIPRSNPVDPIKYFREFAQMTRASKCLVIAVTVFSVVFMGVAAVMSTARTDWKEKATKEFPRSRITEQTTKIGELDKEIEALDKQQKAALASNAADVFAISAPNTGREAQLEVELEKLIEEAHTLADQIEVEAKKVELKQDEDKRRREEVTRLKSQYEDLVAQKDDALANVKRVRDLLYQARGVLSRVEKRMESLDAERRTRERYEDRDSAPAAARPSNTVK
jgi:chromosome segregation ATPase